MRNVVHAMTASGFLFLAACHSSQTKFDRLQSGIRSILENQKGHFALAFKDLSTGEQIMIHEHESFHAASTMKTPVMIEAYRQAYLGRFSLNDSLVIRNEFKSIVDSSLFKLDSADDSELGLYNRLGERESIHELIYLMITKSSNLATNMMIALVGAGQVTQTMRSLGAMDLLVLRGVEDNKAYAKGLNNTVTAYDLLLIYEKMALGQTVNPEASREMIQILCDQQFREIIPAQLPPGVKVAHKTGWFKSVNHDSGIIFLPDGRKYVLVLLSKEVPKDEDAIRALANISGMIYQYVQGNSPAPSN